MHVTLGLDRPWRIMRQVKVWWGFSQTFWFAACVLLFLIFDWDSFLHPSVDWRRMFAHECCLCLIDVLWGYIKFRICTDCRTTIRIKKISVTSVLVQGRFQTLSINNFYHCRIRGLDSSVIHHLLPLPLYYFTYLLCHSAMSISKPLSSGRSEFCDPPPFPVLRSCYVQNYYSHLNAGQLEDLSASDLVLTACDQHCVMPDTDGIVRIKRWLHCGGHLMSVPRFASLKKMSIHSVLWRRWLWKWPLDACVTQWWTVVTQTWSIIYCLASSF